MAITIPDGYRQTRADTLATRAGNASLLRIYTGTPPATADDSATGTLLAELTCGSPFAGAASSEGVATANAITQDSSANATGTAGWYRHVQSNGTTVVCDGIVTATGGGGDCQLVTTSIVSGQPVQVSSYVWTEAGATR